MVYPNLPGWTVIGIGSSVTLSEDQEHMTGCNFLNCEILYLAFRTSRKAQDHKKSPDALKHPVGIGS